jgi:hypothetical protein
MKTSAFLLLVLFSIPGALSALPAHSVTESLARLQSLDYDTRVRGFNALFDPPLSVSGNARDSTFKLLRDNPGERDEIAEALISLLTRENSLINEAPSGSLPESYGDYHASLIWSVAALADGRAVNALMGAIQTGGLATDGLATLGARALPAVLAAADSSESDVRLGATITLGKMAARSAALGLDGAAIDTIKTGLLRTLDDASAFVRVAAVMSLGPFDDTAVADAMRRATGDDSDDVRIAASEWLAKHSF